MTVKFLPILVGLSICFTFSCCNDEDVYHSLPDETGRYYDNNDTISFYCSETDTYETFTICYHSDGFLGDEIRDTYCSWVDYKQRKNYKLYLDSCGTQRFFYIGFNKVSKGSNIKIDSYYKYLESGGDHTSFYTDTTELQTFNILGSTYDDVYFCTFHSFANDSLKSVLVSIEYGIIQYSFENSTYSLLNDENL